MKEWNIHRCYLDKFFKLSNNQYLKIRFSYVNTHNIWNMNIIVANTKRKCNDCFNKTRKSPKVLFGRHTGRKLGIEALKIAKDELLKFEKSIYDTQINILGATKELEKVYTYLARYGYIKHIENNKQVMFKKIN